MFLNTDRTAADSGELAKTTFYFNSSGEGYLTMPYLIPDMGGHTPSRDDEIFAPFHPDPSQRVLAIGHYNFVSVVRTEGLLRLAREREGEHLQWREWKTHVTWIVRDGYTSRLWVSGPRVCCADPTESGGTSIDVYDFGAQASAKYVESVKGRMSQRFTPSVTKIVPWEADEINASHGHYDSLSFVLVKTSRPYTSNRN